MILPPNYAWLADVDPPRIIREAVALLGTKEKAGPGDNPTIIGWARELGISNYSADSIPWCGLFTAVVCARASWPPVHQPLWARNWANFGARTQEAALGDVLVFERGTGGHVGFYIAEDDEAFHVLGGNQGDAVSIVRIAKTRLLAARRPVWRAAQPASVKPYKVAAGGTLSTNEG